MNWSIATPRELLLHCGPATIALLLSVTTVFAREGSSSSAFQPQEMDYAKIEGGCLVRQKGVYIVVVQDDDVNRRYQLYGALPFGSLIGRRVTKHAAEVDHKAKKVDSTVDAVVKIDAFDEVDNTKVCITVSGLLQTYKGKETIIDMQTLARYTVADGRINQEYNHQLVRVTGSIDSSGVSSEVVITPVSVFVLPSRPPAPERSRRDLLVGIGIAAAAAAGFTMALRWQLRGL